MIFIYLVILFLEGEVKLVFVDLIYVIIRLFKSYVLYFKI